jgi:serine/threonine protein kinase
MAGDLTELYGPGGTDSYSIDHTFSLSLSDGQTCTATVVKAFTPFTQSQILLVNVHGCAAVSNPAILKIYDPRYMNDREQAPPSLPRRPWSLELEIAAAQRRDAITRGEREDDYEDGDRSADPVLFEEQLYRAATDAFETERAAYEHLHALQGIGVPRCYAAGTVHPASGDANYPRPINPSFLLLEYVEGFDLSTVDAKLVPRTLARRLLLTVHELGQCGVVHGDLHKSNIIFSHGPAHSTDAPFSRVVILDFGQAILREDEVGDDDWNELVESEGDFRRACLHLHQAGIRDEDPVLPHIFPNPAGPSHVSCHQSGASGG